jgi:hypothetical protein
MRENKSARQRSHSFGDLDRYFTMIYQNNDGIVDSL